MIFELHKKYPLRVLLEASGVKKSSYYRWLRRHNCKSLKDIEDEMILGYIKCLYDKHKGRYGVDRITHALINDYGVHINHKRVYRLMKCYGLLAVIKEKKTYTKPGEAHPKHNILKRNFDTSCPFDKLATDVTEMKKSGNKVYLSPIKDLHTGMIESFEISKHPSLTLAIATIDRISEKAIPEGTYLHSDQGGIYNNPKFQERLEKNNFIQSMSRKGTPIDNAPMESFFGTFKSELLYNPLIEIPDNDALIDESIKYIDYYNNERIQKKLGYQTPAQFKASELLRIKKQKVQYEL